MMKKIINLLLCTSFCFSVFATSDFAPLWREVEFTDLFNNTAKIKFDLENLTEVSLTQGTQTYTVPKSELVDIELPRLNTAKLVHHEDIILTYVDKTRIYLPRTSELIDITKIENSTSTEANPPENAIELSYQDQGKVNNTRDMRIEFSFGKKPSYGEYPTVQFIFSEDKYQKRIVTKKTSETIWQDYEKLPGKKSQESGYAEEILDEDFEEDEYLEDIDYEFEDDEKLNNTSDEKKLETGNKEVFDRSEGTCSPTPQSNDSQKDLKCHIKLTDNFGELTVSLKNESDEEINLNGPRQMSIKDLVLIRDDELKSPFITFKLELKWGKEWHQQAELFYLNQENKNIESGILTLLPGEKEKYTLNMSDTMVSRRCNMVPFKKCFTKGKTPISITLSLIELSGEKETVLSSSNEITFKAKYIF